MSSPTKRSSGSNSPEGTQPKRQRLTQESEEDLPPTQPITVPPEVSWRNKPFKDLTEEELQALADMETEENLLLRNYPPIGSSSAPSPSKSSRVGSPTSIHSAISEDSYALAVHSPNLTSDYVAESMHMQVQRLYMQKKLAFDPDYIKSVRSPMIDIPQSKYIIKNVASEWENKLQKWFDHLLKLKLKEQLDAYVKFSNDQLKREDNSPPNPSYLM